MPQIDTLRDRMPDAAKDLKLNIQSVLAGDKLTKDQAYGCAIASAMFLQQRELVEALVADYRTAPGNDGAAEKDKILDDAKAAAAIMAMNTIYYRFRHMAKNEKFKTMSPRLRMNRMSQPATDKATFELMAMSIAALEGCEMCLGAHEASIVKHGLTEEHVHDAVRIAAVIKGFTVAMSL